MHESVQSRKEIHEMDPMILKSLEKIKEIDEKLLALQQVLLRLNQERLGMIQEMKEYATIRNTLINDGDKRKIVFDKLHQELEEHDLESVPIGKQGFWNKAGRYLLTGFATALGVTVGGFVILYSMTDYANAIRGAVVGGCGTGLMYGLLTVYSKNVRSYHKQYNDNRARDVFLEEIEKTTKVSHGDKPEEPPSLAAAEGCEVISDL